MENCAILEADLEQKQKLEDECQRLRDQARDLDNDLAVEKKKKTSFNELIKQAHQESLSKINNEDNKNNTASTADTVSLMKPEKRLNNTCNKENLIDNDEIENSTPLPKPNKTPEAKRKNLNNTVK